MIEYLTQFKTLALTALFNPVFLVLLLILFFAGKFVGKLTRNLNIWKILLIAYCSLFLYAPVRDAGPFLGGIFLLGIASNHIGSFFSVFGWAQNLGDVIYAFRYRSAYEDIRRRERDLEERERRLKEEERKRAYSDQEQGRQKTDWQQEAKDFRKKARPGQSTGERENLGGRGEERSRGSGQQRTARPSSPPRANDLRSQHLQT